MNKEKSMSVAALPRPTPFASAVEALNTRYHKLGLRVFMVIVVAHWVEHLVQAFQIWALGMERAAAQGAVGYLFPWLVESEAIHYGYAVIMLIGLILFRPGFVGQSRKWWDAALVIQFWHHIEHFLLLGQAVAGTNLFGQPVPTSVAQLVVGRVELHLLYNGLVFIPMIVAMALDLRPPKEDLEKMTARARFTPTIAITITITITITSTSRSASPQRFRSSTRRLLWPGACRKAPRCIFATDLSNRW
jgi:hypothetical protein